LTGLIGYFLFVNDVLGLDKKRVFILRNVLQIENVFPKSGGGKRRPYIF